MRRTLFLALAALITLGMLAPPAFAQIPPTPRVTISGLVDNMTTVQRNLTDLNFTDDRDEEWYARTRGRFDISGEIGRAKAVLGIEIDAYYGLTGGRDNFLDNQIQAAGTRAGAGFGFTGQGSGATSGFDLNTDVVANIEVKWLYVEFPLPLIPFDSMIRVGAQPFATTYKAAVLATGDFAGVNLVTTFTPNIRWHVAYAQIEESLSGVHTPLVNSLSPSGRLTPENLNFVNGDDFAVITSVEVTPIKGLDIRPIYAFLYAEGGTSSSARVPVGQLSPLSVLGVPTQSTPVFCLSQSVVAGVVGPFVPDATCGRAASGAPFTLINTQKSMEYRHTVGFDARWTKGPFSFRPTFFYQFGTREQVNPFTNQIQEADISAFFGDAIAGYRFGPFLLEARGLYTTGNRPKDQLWQNVNYYQPIDTDTSYGGDGWGNIFALGIDYFQGAIRTLGTGIGWDRYGRFGGGLKGTYSFTPALDVYLLGQAAWTARKVDTDEIIVPVPVTSAAGQGVFGSVLVPNINDPNGDEDFLGAELNAGLTWRFAPGLTLDVVYAHLFSGAALNQRQIISTPTGLTTQKRDSKDVDTGVVRVRFTF
jgi:hypothetical protein